MSEFDINLISAFAKCPAFYDKSNPNFKDRAFTENAWKEISLQLGFDEKVLRDRMFQLRNRYNLEKRKVEMQDGDPNAKSTWPLFERMSFLEGHIRPRKSYKSIMNRSLETNDPHPMQQFANNPMFFNHRPNQQMRSYPQHHFAMQNAHNARLHQLASHIQMMANNVDESQLDLSGADNFPGLPNNLMMDMFEGEDRSNPLQLFQHHNLQQQLQNQQLQQQRHQQRRDGGDSSEIKAEYYSESEDDEDGLRDADTDATNKNKDDSTSAFANQVTNASTSNQVLGELLGSVVDTNSARNDQIKNGNGNGTDQNEGVNEEEDNFINPMELLMNRQSTGSAQSSSGSNVRYAETAAAKRKGEALTQSTGYQGSQSGPGSTYKRRRRNYQNMIPNGLQVPDHMKSNLLVGNQQMNMGALASSQGQNALLTNQALLLAQLQNNLMNGQTFLQPTPTPAAAPVVHGGNSKSPDKFTAFGQFMASSLAELNGTRALDLIAKFTVEVVNALRDQKNEQSASTNPPMQQQQQQQQLHPVENHINTNNSTGSTSNVLNPGDDKFRTHQF